MTKCRPIVPNQNVQRLKLAEAYKIQRMIDDIKAGFPALPRSSTHAKSVRVARKQALMMNVGIIDCQHISPQQVLAMVMKAV